MVQETSFGLFEVATWEKDQPKEGMEEENKES